MGPRVVPGPSRTPPKVNLCRKMWKSVAQTSHFADVKIGVVRCSSFWGCFLIGLLGCWLLDCSGIGVLGVGLLESLIVGLFGCGLSI